MDQKYNQKVEEIEKNYDPLNVLPQEILDMVFGYLRVKDLLKLSLVSWNWYNIIGKSECIKSINLVYKYGYGETDYMKSLLNSNRQYQKIIINNPQDNPFAAKTILTVEKEVKNILEKFAGSIKFIDTKMDVRCCELPKLRKLSCNITCRSFYTNGLFSKMELIEDLTISHHRGDENFIELYKDMLTSAKNLKVLKISTFFFYFPILKECKFKLRELRCCGSIETLDFLKMQSETLEFLHINLYYDDVTAAIFSVILTMPNLNKLNINSPFYTTIRGYLPTNKTIKYLELQSSFNPNILAFLENLQVLKVLYLSATVMQDILSCRSLRKVIYVQKNVQEEILTSVQYSKIQFIKIELDRFKF